MERATCIGGLFFTQSTIRLAKVRFTRSLPKLLAAGRHFQSVTDFCRGGMYALAPASSVHFAPHWGRPRVDTLKDSRHANRAAI